ncbi:MAG TPA: metalloregulator ArsR/SmtB family transcription factor [Thermodesulfobacteriota bacterium]|nr:metalloregulator ArsR/SmtB family transcription factor [Thermodesulfobacteriota bacterium]
MRNFISVTKALSDENRVRILLMLCEGELCVCRIIEVLGLAPSTVSKHLSVLHQAHLTNGRKDGRWMYYRLSEDAPPDAATAIRWVKDSLWRSKRA